MKIKMKFFAVLLILGFHASAQTSPEREVLNLSHQIFTWEVDNKIDQLESIFDAQFIVVGSDGGSQDKQQYISRLRSGNFIHNAIEVIEDKATVADNTATVVGKGRFTVTVSDKKINLLLSYIEVFTRATGSSPWKVLAMHATKLEK